MPRGRMRLPRDAAGAPLWMIDPCLSSCQGERGWEVDGTAAGGDIVCPRDGRDFHLSVIVELRPAFFHTGSSYRYMRRNQVVEFFA